MTVGTRDPESTPACSETDFMGNEPFAAWQARQADIRLAGYAQAAAEGELVINATAGGATLDALGAAGAGALAGKVLIDTAVPNDFTAPLRRPMLTAWGGPAPLLNPVATDSLAEQIQRAFPDSRVVKALNTVSAALMAAPASLEGVDHTVFLSSDFADAEEQVAHLLAAYGRQDIVDLGDLATARATEMIQPLYLALARPLGHEHFNLKLVR
ncbi:NADP oxidoreductase [Streptomyces sp. NPDC041068]|uniref:NADPH-dependent F420 reductase n=1 Tax=Streptomyces sp. NPDC041068 TaxID=3155130 RepID=UPI0033C9D88C